MFIKPGESTAPASHAAPGCEGEATARSWGGSRAQGEEGALVFSPWFSSFPCSFLPHLLTSPFFLFSFPSFLSYKPPLFSHANETLGLCGLQVQPRWTLSHLLILVTSLSSLPLASPEPGSGDAPPGRHLLLEKPSEAHTQLQEGKWVTSGESLFLGPPPPRPGAAFPPAWWALV